MDWRPFCTVIQHARRGVKKPLRVVKVNEDVKGKLLKIQPKGLQSSTTLLERVRTIDSWAASKLSAKSHAIDNLTLRMVCEGVSNDERHSDPRSNGGFDLPDSTSFIALSYCWHSHEWYPATGLMQDPQYTTKIVDSEYPVLHPMWTALLDERLNDSEPIWVDQMCIDQNNEFEKLQSIGTMDLLYANARQVVVALEDAQLDDTDMETLMEYASYIEDKYPSGLGEKVSAGFMEETVWLEEKQAALHQACSRIFDARWFSRAWCTHEMWMGPSHVFLAPLTVRDPTVARSREYSSILRFNMPFLLSAHHSASQWLLRRSTGASTISMAVHLLSQALQPSSSTTIASRTPSQTSNALSFTHAAGFAQRSSKGKVPPHLSTSATIMRSAARETFDKLPIVLNANRTGLYLHEHWEVTDAEASWIATVVALASCNATALAAAGRLMASDHAPVGSKSAAERGWACIPGKPWVNGIPYRRA